MALADTLRAKLSEVADPARAAGMQAYMKSAMPYLGVSAVPLRQVCKSAFSGLTWPDSAAWQAEVLAIWRGARHREERYAAIELTGVRAAAAFQRIDALPMYEEMIVDGAWWDYVDAIATQRFWPILQQDRAAMTEAMLAWSRRRRSVEAAQRDHLPDQGQGGDRPRPALRLHRAGAGFEGILPAQGDRLGAAPICLDRSRRGAALRRGQRKTAERPQPARGAEEYRGGRLMAATPAWPPHSLPRLFVDQPLARGAERRPSTAIISPRCCASGRATR